MVSLSIMDSRQGSGGGGNGMPTNNRTSTPISGGVGETTTATTTTDSDMEQLQSDRIVKMSSTIVANDEDTTTCGSPIVELSNSAKATLIKKQQRQQLQLQAISPTSMDDDLSCTRLRQLPSANSIDDNSSSGEPDEEQLRRILTCKRLSEGCNRFNPVNSCAAAVGRKNSLHMIGEELPPVTEGEAMPQRHMSYYLSQTIQDQHSSGSSGSLRSGARVATKRSSQDDNTTSCSSSTSLDGSGPRSPSRRRSSTVSQCSSVLSEGTRQQLNFDLSPDLPLDSSLLEANATSPTDLDCRPASPEPLSFSGDEGSPSYELRPVSRMSHDCDTDLMLTISPDSTLGDSNEQPTSNQQQLMDVSSEISRQVDDAMPTRAATAIGVNIRDNLERLINDVSTVKVSARKSNQDVSHSSPFATDQNQNWNYQTNNLASAQKRAHTPIIGADLQQRNKSSPNQRTDASNSITN